ncbi:MAG: hypothetical protein Q7R52_00190 [archaeon]|nr:hypothetical protein [archaeon]
MKNETNTKVGQYECYKQEKGFNEALGIDIKEGEIFWTIRLSKDGYYDTKSQDTAEILSRLVKIEQMLKRRK